MENNFKYIVYQTINIVNNKIYVGYHRTSNPDVFDGYIGNGVNINYPSTYMKPKFPFQYAVKKYGTSNFRRSVLYIFEEEQEALDKEEEIVNEEFIRRSDTYNVALGGIKRPFIPTYRKIYQFNTSGELLKEWDNIYDISEFIQTWKESIYSAINNKQRLYGSYWSYNSNINIAEYSNPNPSRKVYKYNKEGKCIDIYQSVGEAANCNNMTPNHVINTVQNGAFTKEKFYLSYELYDEYVQKPRRDLKGKTLFVYDLKGNFIDQYNIKDFKKKYDIHTYKEISNVILNEKSIKGMQIRLEKFNKISEYSPKNRKRAVILYTISGEIVEEFESIAAACKKYKLDSSTVSKILRGCAKSTKGYTIKYKN